MKKKNRILMYPLLIAGLILVLANSCKKDNTSTTPAAALTPIINPLVYGSMTDIDGNTYKTIKIGTQTWMAENLKVTRYRNGDTIPNVTNNTEWNNLSNGAWCYYNNMPVNNSAYGKLYNRYAVEDSRNIATTGWHVPTFDEWILLLDYFGGNKVAAGKLMEAGKTHWNQTNSYITNLSGFTALPGGECAGISFYNLGNCGYYRASNNGQYFQMISGDIFVSYLSNTKNGYSVRLVKDSL